MAPEESGEGKGMRKERDNWIWHATAEESVWNLLLRQGVGKKLLADLAKQKLLLVEGKAVDTRYMLSQGQVVELRMPKEKLDHDAVQMELRVLYEDEDLLVIDKPSGITVNSVGQISIANGVAHYFMKRGIERKIRFLNRLDRDTSGCLVIAKSTLAQALYQRELEERRFHKFYRAIVEGKLEGNGMIEVPMRKSADGIHQEVHPEGKMTKTYYEAISSKIRADGSVVTMVELEIFTGKTHQIRVSMAYLGHPLEGDVLYGAALKGKSFSLVAERIAWTDLRTGEEKTVVI